MTQVKICGITNLSDAVAALEAGADLLGFICYPKSPRYITPGQIKAILNALQPQLGGQRTVGVFVDEVMDNVRLILAQTGLHLAQLHGGETPEMVAELAGRAFKALRPTSVVTAAAEAGRFAHLGPADGPVLLLDGHHPTLYGGSGRRADWDIAAALAQQYRLLLAGGLTPDNVAQAIERVQPWGVDVSSGVEREPRRKDHAAVQAFISAAKSASPFADST